MGEDRLREALRDPGWSLPVWPDAQQRVRRAARRQRLKIASVGAAVTAVITMAAMVPVAALGGISAGPAGPAGGSGGGRPGGPGGHILTLAIPAVGATGFPVRTYPAPGRTRIATPVLRLCPARAGLRAPGMHTAAAALIVLRRLGRSFGTDLRLSDRAFWPQVVSGWSASTAITAMPPPTRASRLVVGLVQPVLYSGPLQFSLQARGAPGRSQVPRGAAVTRILVMRRIVEVRRIVEAGCGGHLVRDSWVVVSGHPATPAREDATLFVSRRGRLLVYNSE